jgi:DNA-binding response OmpR family regulator
MPRARVRKTESTSSALPLAGCVISTMSHLLIADDSDVLRRLIVSTLHEAELPIDGILEARDGRETARIAANDRRIGAILVDASMPHTDCVALVRELRDRCEAPIVVLGTSTQTDTVRAAIAAGARASATKPFTAASIRSVLLPLLAPSIASSQLVPVPSR